VAKKGDERLRARVDATALAAEDDAFAGLHLFLRRKLLEYSLVDRQIETGIATLDRVTDPVVLSAVEEDDLIGLGDNVILADMPLEDAAIGVDEACLVSAFLVALVSAFAIADDIADHDGFRLQQQSRRNL